jgi:anti-anti-sigma factor
MSFESPSFQLDELTLDDQTSIIDVRGEVHVSTAPEFSDRLNEAISRGMPGVVVDMTRVAFIDSTGLGVLLTALRRVTRRQGRLALAVSNPTVRRLFEITQMDATFDILPDRASAIAHVRRDDAAAGLSGSE